MLAPHIRTFDRRPLSRIDLWILASVVIKGVWIDTLFALDFLLGLMAPHALGLIGKLVDFGLSCALLVVFVVFVLLVVFVVL